MLHNLLLQTPGMDPGGLTLLLVSWQHCGRLRLSQYWGTLCCPTQPLADSRALGPSTFGGPSEHTERGNTPGPWRAAPVSKGAGRPHYIQHGKCSRPPRAGRFQRTQEASRTKLLEPRPPGGPQGLWVQPQGRANECEQELGARNTPPSCPPSPKSRSRSESRAPSSSSTSASLSSSPSPAGNTE